MLRESLEKKIEILDAILDANELKREVLTNPMATPDDLEATYNRKDELISVMEALDNGFETMYKRVRKELSENREIYADEIKKMQELISEISDRSASIRAGELRNKELATRKFSDLKGKINKVKKSRSAMNSYYQASKISTFEDASILDSRK
jgi:galactose-1-phosphate uridylyltransferase